MLEFYFGSLNGNFYLSSYVAYIFLGVFPRRWWVHWKQKPWLNHLWILRIYQGPSELSEWAINSSSLNFSRSKSQLLLQQIYSSKSNLCTWMYIDYAVLPLFLNAKHGFLSLWYFGISPCVEAKTMFNCFYTCAGKAFRRQLFPNRESLRCKLHHLLSLWWWWGSKTKPNQPWCGLWTQDGAEPKCS